MLLGSDRCSLVFLPEQKFLSFLFTLKYPLSSFVWLMHAYIFKVWEGNIYLPLLSCVISS
jgi:hypothetical protein